MHRNLCTACKRKGVSNFGARIARNGLSGGGEATEKRPESLNHERHQPSRTRAQNADRVHNSGYIETVDQATNRNLRPLIRMSKAWQEHCSVAIKSFQLELIASEFLAQCPWRIYDFFWFDWISRDFFLFLYWKANKSITVPGSGEVIYLGNDWQSRAESAYRRAVKACDYEKENQIAQAGEEWQKIFGQHIPRTL
jgi:hypothetical protein